MGSNIFYDNIQKYLFQYVDLLQHSNSVGLTDKAVHAENVFTALLNLIFGWKLVNANEIKKNQDGFDLIFTAENVYVQVTTNKSHQTKFNNTLRSVKKNNVGTSRLIVLFISKQVDPLLLLQKSDNGLTYESFDIPKLLTFILYKCPEPEKLEAINHSLQLTVSPVLLARQLPNQNLPVVLPKQRVLPLTTGLYVPRKELIEDLFAFIQQDNGLLIGGPGFGKSFILEEVQRYCIGKNIDCFIIRINDLTYGTNEEIGKELKLDQNWMDTLPKLNPSGFKSLLIFDAYDTAKDEHLKSNILKAIKTSLQELRPEWHILVSVRTYDATKSRKLLELFPNQNVRQAVSCRNFLIPEFSDEELEAVFQSTVKLKGTLEKCNPQLRQLLKTPYFLKLFESILTDEMETNVFNAVETEEQLLDVFWMNKIEDVTDKDLFLIKLTSQLVAKESLVCDRADIVTEANAKIYSDLISLGIIEEVSVTRQKLAFNHNILLDFAISKYLLKQDVEEQINYISANEKIPFIFRQSFIYFYTRLYKSERLLFWKHYRKVKDQAEPLFRLLHQTTLNYVLINFFDRPEDLMPIFSEQDREKKGLSLRKVLEGVRFINKGDIRPKDVDLLLSISKDLHWMSLWECGLLIEQAIGKFASDPNNSHFKKLSVSSCNYLEFVLTARKDVHQKRLIDGNGAVRGIGNLCKTLPINLPKVKKLFGKVLLILEEDEFPIDYFFNLSHNIVDIYQHDSALGSLIYRKLYDHTETSTKETNLGGGVVMALRSNRKQDYGMVYHALEESFTELLNMDFHPAMQLGIAIVNKTNSYRNTALRETVKIKIGEIESNIYSDYSFYDNDRDHGPSSHIIKIFEILDRHLSDPASVEVGIEQIKRLIPEIEAAMVWRRLFKLIAKHPKALKEIAFDLLSTREFYVFDETTYEAGELIRAVWQYFSVAKRTKIEGVITSLLEAVEDFGRAALAQGRVNILLYCIPDRQVVTQKAKDMLTGTKALNNVPFVSDRPILAADVRFSSREELIKRSGFNVLDDVDMLHYTRKEEMEAFNDKFEKKENKLYKRDFKSVLGYVELLFLEAQSWPKLRKESVELQVARFSKVISSMGRKLNIYERGLVKRIALQYINDQTYHGLEYESGDLKSSWGGFSATARIASIQTLLNLMYTFNEKDIEDLVLCLMGDNVQIVRFKSLHGLGYFFKEDNDRYWLKINERGMAENDSLCLHELLRAVCWDGIMAKDREKVEKVVELIIPKIQDIGEDVAREIWQVLIVIVLKLILHHESIRARQLVTENLSIKEFMQNMIFEIMNVIDPHSLENDYGKTPGKYENLIAILLEIVQYRFEIIHKKGLASPDITDDLLVIDHAIQHLFFAVEKGRKGNRKNTVEAASRKAFYLKVKPILDLVVEQSTRIDSGFMVAHTGYYFIQMLNSFLDLDPGHILYLSNTIITCAAKTGLTYDGSTLKEIVKLTERIIADHREILYINSNFNNLIVVLDQFANSGWQEAMEMTWRLKEAF